MPRQALQLSLPRHAGWGGARRGAGRKRVGSKALVPHVVRPPHAARHPVHVTLRALAVVGSLRQAPAFLAREAAIRAASSASFRVVHFSVRAW